MHFARHDTFCKTNLQRVAFRPVPPFGGGREGAEAWGNEGASAPTEKQAPVLCNSVGNWEVANRIVCPYAQMTMTGHSGTWRFLQPEGFPPSGGELSRRRAKSGK